MSPPEGSVEHATGNAGALPGYGPDVEKNRTEGRKIMQNRRLWAGQPPNVKLATRNVAPDRDSAVIPPDGADLDRCRTRSVRDGQLRSDGNPRRVHDRA
jgi:hypothetical protein